MLCGKKRGRENVRDGRLGALLFYLLHFQSFNFLPLLENRSVDYETSLIVLVEVSSIVRGVDEARTEKDPAS